MTKSIKPILESSEEPTTKIDFSENFLIWAVYQLTKPVAKFFSFLGVTPNALTFCSLLLVGISNYFIIIQGRLMIFTLFWVIAIFLDFVDGQVARMTNKSRQHSFSFDHTGDLVKICSTFISIAVRYQSNYLWIMTSVSICMVLFSDRLNTDLAYALKDNSETSIIQQTKKRHFIATNVYTVFLTFNSHSLFLIPFALINARICAFLLAYFIAISSISCGRFIFVLINTPNK